MGIPHLTRFLSPYSTPIHFSGAGDTTENTTTTATATTTPKRINNVIIDGPGLVYHVHNLLLSRKPSHLNAIDALPSCAEVSAGVAAVVGALLGGGVEV